MSVFFAKPCHSWEKCAVENYNKYIPKKADFDLFSEQKLITIQYGVNERPREKLNFDSPKKAFFILITKLIT